uniref:Collagen alpha-6(VI) chain-like n=1 Tax=Phallusia mammillata TaxID=59560 RepID=A0A6F9D9Y6_9ASCI|nr:collagen alpha-6(VI) chain-like [Phallusia mammillata]
MFSSIWKIFMFIALSWLCTTVKSQRFDGVPGCRTTKLELVFVVDGSSSVSRDDFRLAKQWIHNMTLNFDVSPDTTRVAVVQYSTEPRTEFELDSYEDSRGVVRGINHMQHMSGNTQTGKALRYVIDQVFVRARPGSSKVAIVISDGRSQDEAKQAAAALQTEGIATFAVGVGDMTSSGGVSELRQIANMADDSDSVFMVEDFQSIGKIQEKLIEAVCEQTVKECPTAKNDLAFVIDASSTIGYEDFAKVKAWMKNIVNAFDIGPDQTRVAVIQYSTYVQEEFNFGQLLSKEEVLAAIDRMDYVMGDTHTGDALMYLLNAVYTEGTGDRPDIPNIAIVMTDGKAQERHLVETAAQRVHDAGITVYTVGVADYSLEEIQVIASDPDENYVIEALDFDLIEMKRLGLIKSICSETEQTCPSTSAEIVFLIDGSNSIGYDNFQKLKLWMKNIVDAFQIGPDYTRVGVVQFTESPHLEIGLSDHEATQSALMAIQEIRYKRGGTNIGRAIDFTINRVFSESRDNVPRILITLTDGQSQDDVTRATQRAEEAGIHTLVFGVGDEAPAQLRQMVAQEDNMFHASGFDEIQRMHSKLVSLICVEAEPECASQEVDIHFLVDGSESIGIENLNKVKTWMKNIVNSFDLGEYTTRVALTQYSSDIRAEFSFSEHATKREIAHAIDQMTLMGGPTFTGQALDRMREEGFSEDNGGRSGAPKVLIVLTDGRSGDNIEFPAKKLHDDGVYVFAIGAGDTWTSALQVIGSAPVVTHVQEAASYDAINRFRRDLVGEICRETKPECADSEMDLIFLVDGSSSIGQDNFEVTKEWMISFVRQFEIGEYNTKIGVTQYSSQVRTEIEIGEYDGQAELIEAIKSIEFATGRTHTGSALDYIRNIGFSAQRGARRGVPKVLIVFTDGDAQDEVSTAANRLRAVEIEVYTIGVGRANMGQLTASMATESPNAYHVKNYNAIKTIQSRLLRNVCERVEPDCANTATDLMFLVDGSTSVGHQNWATVKSFMKNMTEKFRIGADVVRVGVLQYSTWPRTDITMGEHNDKEALDEAIDGLKWRLGDTYTARALRYVSRSYAEAEVRPNLIATKLLIVITDGRPQDQERVADAVRTLHSQGWRIFAIGIGQVAISELGVLASDPDYDHVFHADDYNSTSKFQGRLTRLICHDSDFGTVEPSTTSNVPSRSKTVTPGTNRNEPVIIRSSLRNPSRLSSGNNWSPKTPPRVTSTTGSGRNQPSGLTSSSNKHSNQPSGRLRSTSQNTNQPSGLLSSTSRNNNQPSGLTSEPSGLKPSPASLTAATSRTPPKQKHILNGTGNGSCPALRREGKRTAGVDFLDAMGARSSSRLSSRSVNLGKQRRGSSANLKSLRIRSGAIPIMAFTQLLPEGLPIEFAFIATFRMHGKTIKTRWTLLNIVTPSGSTLFSVSFNGPRKSIIISRASTTSATTVQTSALGGPLVAKLFDRTFHKLELLADAQGVTVMVDCQQVPTQVKHQAAFVDYTGAVLAFLPRSNASAIIDLQDLTIRCDADEAEDCCEIPGSKCSTLTRSFSPTVSGTCGCLPEQKSPEVRKAEAKEITKLATKIATQLVEEKFGRLLAFFDLTPEDLLDSETSQRSVQILNRRAAESRRTSSHTKARRS